jgi:hypothetical protein
MVSKVICGASIGQAGALIGWVVRFVRRVDDDARRNSSLRQILQFSRGARSKSHEISRGSPFYYRHSYNYIVGIHIAVFPSRSLLAFIYYDSWIYLR